MSIRTAALATDSSPPDHRRSSLWVQRLMIPLVLLLLLVIIVTSIAWLILHPIRPVFVLNSITISNFALLNSRVNADYDFELSVNNPNKKVALVIDHFQFTVSYHNKKILSQQSTGFVKLEKASQHNLSSHLRPKHSSGCLVRKDLFNRLSTDLGKKLLKLTLEVKIRTRFMSEIWSTKETRMKVSCNNLNVEFGSAKDSVPGRTGKLSVSGEGEQCRVDYL